MDRHPYLIAAVFLAAFSMVCWTVQVGYRASVEKTRLEMDMRKLKAEKGNQFKLGPTQHEEQH